MSNPRLEKIYIIDSLQSMGFTKKKYDAFMERHPDRLIIFISRLEKRESGVGRTCMWDAGVKVWVEGFRAFCKGRYQEEHNRGKFFTIWEEGAAKFWGE
jgi:hypothetical protein